MRLHRIRLKNFRGVESHDVALSPTGITVIEGDNGVGKTSLIEAVKIIFLYPDSSSRNDVRRNQPLGSDAGVEIEIEVSLGRYRMKYAKSYIRSRSTTLEIIEPAREVLTGRQAHDRAGQILNTNVDTALLWALWLDQGVSLDQADLSRQTSLGAALDRAAGRSADGDAGDPLFRKCESEFEKYFTARGNYRRSIQDVIDKYEDAVAEVDDLTKSIAELDSKNDECERLSEDIERLNSDRSSAAETLADLERRHSEVARVSQEVDTLRTELALANERLRSAMSERDRRLAEIAAISKSQAELDGLNLTAQGFDSRVADAEQGLATAQREVESARDARNESQRLLDLRRDDYTHLLESAGVEGMESRLDTAKQSQENARAAESFLEDCRITDSLLAQIEAKDREILTTRARLESEGASVEIVSLAVQRLVIDGETVDVADGERIEKTGLNDFAFSVPGVIDVAVSAGQGSRQLATDLRVQESDLAALLQSAGADDVNAARQLNDRRIRTEDDLKRDALRQALGDSSIPDLENRITQTRERANTYLANRDSDVAMPPDANAASEEARQAERQVADKQTALDAAEANSKSAESAVADLHARQRELNVEIQIAADRLESDKQSLESARETESDAEIEARVESLSKAATGANALFANAESELAGMDPDLLDARLTAANRIVKSLDTQLQDRREDLRNARAFLSARGEDGLHDELGWSDPTRLGNIGAALNIGAEDCQVIALTCMPDRYSRVGAEKVIRL